MLLNMIFFRNLFNQNRMQDNRFAMVTIDSNIPMSKCPEENNTNLTSSKQLIIN